MPTQVRLLDAVEEYLTFRQARCSAATVKNESFVLRRFAAWYGDVQMRHLRPEKVADWFFGPGGLLHEHRTRDRRTRAPISASTVNYYRTRLSTFFVWARKRDYLRQDPLEQVEPLRVVKAPRLQVEPSRMLDLPGKATNPRDRAFLALLINSAFRAKTATAIRVGDVDLDGLSVHVKVTKSHLEDMFPISGDLAPELSRWLHRYALDLGRPLRSDDYLFPAKIATVYKWVTHEDGTKEKCRTTSGWRPYSPMKNPERVVQDALRGVGVRQTVGEGVHTIRRSVARAYFDAMESLGYDHALRTVSALLHHKSTATTEIYLGLSSERRRRDQTLRGRPFLSAMTVDDNAATVHPIRSAAEVS